jgi:hypothetical protein
MDPDRGGPKTFGSGSPTLIVPVEEVLLTIYSLGEPWKCKKEGDGPPGAWLKFLFFKHYFSPLNTFMRKGKDPDPDPYL